jgi:hypothetical protein
MMAWHHLQRLLLHVILWHPLVCLVGVLWRGIGRGYTSDREGGGYELNAINCWLKEHCTSSSYYQSYYGLFYFSIQPFHSLLQRLLFLVMCSEKAAIIHNLFFPAN